MLGNYVQILGSQRCCNLKIQGPQGPEGTQGLPGIGSRGYDGITGISYTGPTGRSCKGFTGPVGSSAISTTITTLTFDEPNSSTTPLINQTIAISYYNLSLPQGTTLNDIGILSLPIGYQAIIYISVSTIGSATINLAGSTNIKLYNNNSSVVIHNPGILGQFKRAILTLYNDGTKIYGNLSSYY
jgi:hypothetical protein